MKPEVKKIRLGCPAHNCGGRCLLVAHVANGRIMRLDADDRPDTLSSPQLRGCARGRAYLRRQYHPDRLMYPLRRTGRRGEGRFERISWHEALDTVAHEMQRVKAAYGSSALFVPYGTGSYNQLNGSSTVKRLMNCFGGYLGTYNNYSWAAIQAATPTVYGTQYTGNTRQDWLNSRYILMWGWNPAEMRDDTNSDYFIRLARENGARVVCIDPRLSMSAAGLADEWIPIRPGTDTAMMSAMAYVMITEGLYDAEFVKTHCSGFDAAQMPPGAENAESFRDYILGVCDGVSKTPAWAESITAVPAETISRIAREYATAKPAVLYQGYGMQRRAYGEQVARAGCVLAAITGNVGISGGWASGMALPAEGRPFGSSLFPVGENPVKAKIPVFLWTEAVERGKQMGAADGLGGADHLDNDIKLIYAVATNCLINQHANTNRTARMLQDEKKVEFLVVQDNFLTPTGKFADIVLPACTQFETWGLEDGWKFNNEILLMPQVVEPPGETKSDYRICTELAQRLGLEDEYTQGRDERAWVGWMIEKIRQTRFPQILSLDEFEASNAGYYGLPVEEPVVAFADFRRDPEAYPLDTPSGKIDIFSSQLHDLNRPLDIPAVPKYIREWESPFGEEAGRYPLQAIGHHTMQRVHSTHDNVDWLEEAFPQRIFINPLDAATRNIHDGDWVKVFNDRGTIALPCRITAGIMPGVVDIPQGAWWTPDEKGIDWRGSVNVLTSERWTPFAFGNTQQTIMVQVEAIDVGDMPAQIRDCLQNEYPAAGIVKTKISPDSKEGQLFFYFDASACTGCKSCQEACKDRNGLPVGMLWRRVYEISGGEWRQCGPAWQHDVVSYHLSIACIHCENPVCMDVCPADAIQKRPDGIVWIDEECCIGCQSCSEACPYGAMQFDERSQQMTKCDFCAEDIDAGKAPACVAACPMRVLDYGERAELEAKYHIRLNEQTTVYPLPAYEHTRPALLMRNHKDAERAEGKLLAVTNREEVE